MATAATDTYRHFTGTGHAMVVVEDGGRVIVYQNLEIPVDGKRWRILAATPREGVMMEPGRVQGPLAVTADSTGGSLHGLMLTISPSQGDGEATSLYLSLDHPIIREKPDAEHVIPVIGVQARDFTDEQIDTLLEDLWALDTGVHRDQWAFLLDAAGFTGVVPPAGANPWEQCTGGGPGATSCTIVDGEYSKSVTCGTGYYACCGGYSSGIFAICCENPPQ